MLSKKEIQHIAKLARLKLTNKEIEKYQKEFLKILNYIKKLKKAKFVNWRTKTKSQIYITKIKNVIRDDKEKTKQEIENEKLLELAPDRKNRYLKVKSIITTYQH
jgi:aspartyl-tRNA(Asn)/glutamyl-tRNA(Gln) amidotransferase subunit C